MDITNNTNTLYMIAYREIKRRITENIYRENTYIPTEKELQEEFNMSRITIRRAISELERKGLVRSQQGKGTIVCDRKGFTDLFRLSGFKEEAIKEGDIPSSIIIDFSTLEASAELARNLQINEGDRVYYLERLRLLNRRVTGLHKTFINEKIGKKIDIDNWGQNFSLYEFYDENGYIVSTANELIQVMLPEKKIADLLHIDYNEPIFYRERITFDDKNDPIEFSQNYYIAKEHRYFVRMEKLRDIEGGE